MTSNKSNYIPLWLYLFNDIAYIISHMCKYNFLRATYHTGKVRILSPLRLIPMQFERNHCDWLKSHWVGFLFSKWMEWAPPLSFVHELEPPTPVHQTLHYSVSPQLNTEYYYMYSHRFYLITKMVLFLLYLFHVLIY